MTAFVHIGIGKTGTTSIQACLYESRNRLLELGFLYPQSGLLGIAHYGFFDLQTMKLTDVSFAKLSEEIKSSEVENVVVSSENLTYAPLPVIDRLWETLGADARIVFYVREQGGLISSTFLQWVKDGWDYRGSIDEFLELHQSSFDYLKLIKPWADRFGSEKVVAHVYHPAVVGTNVAEHFLGILGVTGIQVANERQNPSLLPEFFDAISCVDQAGIEPAARREIVSHLLDASVRLANASSMRLLSPKASQRIHALYAESNQEFAQRYLPLAEHNFLTTH